MLRCPFCRSLSTRWDASGDRLSCVDCDRRITIHREPPNAYDEWTDAPSAGGLDRWIERADDALVEDRRWLLSEITRLDTYRVRVLGTAGKATRCRVTLTILAQCARWLWNVARMRSSEADLIVRAHRKRDTAFAGYRHAAAESTNATPWLGLGGGLRVSDAPAKHGIRGGIQFGRIACSPDTNRTGTARGEDALIDRIDLIAAERAAGLSEADARLLELVDVGAVRSRARRTKRGIAPAIEPLSVPDALERLRTEVVWVDDGKTCHGERRDPSTLPRSPREAKKRIQRARDAMRDALRERGLIPQRERQPARPTPAAAVRPPMQEWT